MTLKTINAMKKKFLLLVALVLFAAQGFAAHAGPAATDIATEQTFVEDLEDMNAPVMFKAPPVMVPMALRTGDVNGDGLVNITDVTALITAVLNEIRVSNGDLNGDGLINITDVTALITIVLNGTQGFNYSLAQSMLDEVYQSMYTAGWTTTGNNHQCFGISAYNLVAEVMGDDMIMGAQGSGWFWYDAAYNVKSRYTSSTWRSYDLWTAYYTWIANANYLLTAVSNMSGTNAQKNYIKGQAYAIRAYSYFMLAQSFARTYKGHENDLCVPIFDGNVFAGTTAQPRSTVAQVYALIDSDIAQAVSLLNGTTQLAPSHMGYAVALGLKARVALVKEDWNTALTSAVEAISSSGKTIQEVGNFAGLNDATAGNVMWGVQIPAENAGMYASLWSHMDCTKSYFTRAPKMISKWLYGMLNETDARQAWWGENTTAYGNGAPISLKFSVKEGTEWEGDYIWMRVEEMYLTAAEAACRLGRTTPAKGYLNALMSKRDPNYSCNKTGTELGALTTDETGSLLEEILIQRRIELWGEDGRIYTIRRLRQGFERSAEYGWPNSIQLTGKALYDPESYAWVLTIPSSEFNGNANMNPEFLPLGDQNPLGDVTGVGQNISFEEATSSLTTARTDVTYKVTLTRESTVGEYMTTISMSDADAGLTLTTLVSFPDGSNTTVASVNCYPLTLGQSYSGTLNLSEYDLTLGSANPRITSHTFTIHCQNGDPAAQKVSFDEASHVYSTSSVSLGVPVTLIRAATDEEYTATITVSDVHGDVSISNTQFFFAKDVSQVQRWLYFNDMEYGQSYSCVLTLSPTDAAAGGEFTSMQIIVTRNNWINIGNAQYYCELFDETLSPEVEQIEGSNTYKLLQLLTSGYDITFTIENNKVYIQSQPCFNTSSYGVIYMHGYANADNSGYAGTYDPETKTADLTIQYYCDAGVFPTCNDRLTMP